MNVKRQYIEWHTRTLATVGIEYRKESLFKFGILYVGIYNTIKKYFSNQVNNWSQQYYS